MHRERIDRDRGASRHGPYTMSAADVLDPRRAAVWQLWLRDYVPFVFVTIALPTAAAALIGPWAAWSMLLNIVLAELLHNAQTFICIRPSHCAADIPLFDKVYANRGDFFLQSVLGTVNYPGGGTRPGSILARMDQLPDRASSVADAAAAPIQARETARGRDLRPARRTLQARPMYSCASPNRLASSPR